MSTIKIISVLPTLDPEFPQQITYTRNGEEAVVYAGVEAPKGCSVYYHPNGNFVQAALSALIAEALVERQRSSETARRAARFAALAELCRGFQ